MCARKVNILQDTPRTRGWKIPFRFVRRGNSLAIVSPSPHVDVLAVTLEIIRSGNIKEIHHAGGFALSAARNPEEDELEIARISRSRTKRRFAACVYNR